MRPIVPLCLAAALAAVSACKSTARPVSEGPSTQPAADYTRPLPEGAHALLPLEAGERAPDFAHEWYARAEILPALENSIAWTRKKSSERYFPVDGITRDRALKSLERFKALLVESKGAEEFGQRIADEFAVYKSAGWDGRGGGGVLFTGYCTPILPGSRIQTADHRYPLYATPPDLVKGPEGEILGQKSGTSMQPYPTRRAIEASGMLTGQKLELAWLADPVDAYIAHVNGSAFVRLADGQMLKFGYAGKNGRDYRSLGAALVADGKLKKDEASLRAIREWAKAHPDEVQGYLDRNDSYVFFRPIDGSPHGSLDVPVRARRSIATDKRLFPRGAITYAEWRAGGGAKLDCFLLDQDTGGAIRTAGRADVYLGVGEAAERVAGATREEGQLYYLFVKGGALVPAP